MVFVYAVSICIVYPTDEQHSLHCLFYDGCLTKGEREGERARERAGNVHHVLGGGMSVNCSAMNQRTLKTLNNQPKQKSPCSANRRQSLLLLGNRGERTTGENPAWESYAWLAWG